MSGERPAEDLARDSVSRPADVFEQLGIGAGMTVLDLNAASGYFTEVLARAVGLDGRVIAHNHPGARTTLGAAAFERRYGGDRLPNVEQLFAAHDDICLPPATLDAVLMSLVYHDTYWHRPNVDWGPVDQAALLAGLYAALVPGGVVGVIDHRAAAGEDPRRSAVATHRIDPAVVRSDFGAAGFEWLAESDLFANPDDALTASVFDAAVQGRTDRFFYIFRKPR